MHDEIDQYFHNDFLNEFHFQSKGMCKHNLGVICWEFSPNFPFEASGYHMVSPNTGGQTELI